MALPTEVYFEIVSYLSGTTDAPSLFALLLTSRLLNKEAEKILYRHLKPSSLYLPQILSHVSTYSRVSQLVRSLEVSVDTRLPREVDYSLRALTHLTCLTIWQTSFSLAAIGYLSLLIRTAHSFQLREFITDSPVDRNLKAFLRSQPQITHLEIHSNEKFPINMLSVADLVLSRVDLPALTALHYSAIPPINSLFPEFFITNLSFNELTSEELTIPLPSVRVLSTHNSRLTTWPPSTFPNLRFLHMEYAALEYLDLHKLSRLQKLKMSIDEDLPPNVADIVLLIYTKHENLKFVEICHQHQDQVTVYRVREWFNPRTMVAEPFSEKCVEDSIFHSREWTSWRD